MYDNPLLLEGGAMRGLYTAGVLDAFMEGALESGCVYGVSAGVLNGINYVAHQPGRSAQVNYACINNPRYFSPLNLLRAQSIFDFDYLFNQISLDMPFDFEAFADSPQRLIAVATNCLTGEPVMFEKGRCAQFFDACAASCSMPMVSRAKRVEGIPCLDGGVSAPVPLDAGLDTGNGRPVLVLTRHRGYRKAPLSRNELRLCAARCRRYPALLERMRTAPERYNALMERIDRLEADGRVFAIRPENPIEIGRLEKDVGKLRALHDSGYAQALGLLPALREFCGRR